MRYFLAFYRIVPTFWTDRFLDVRDVWNKDMFRCVRAVLADDLDQVFTKMQGEVWSPNGEARDIIAGLELHHTSMSIGDVVWDRDDGQPYGTFYQCAEYGWDRVPFERGWARYEIRKPPAQPEKGKVTLLKEL